LANQIIIADHITSDIPSAKAQIQRTAFAVTHTACSCTHTMSQYIAVFIEAFKLNIFQRAFRYQKRTLPYSLKGFQQTVPPAVHISILSYPLLILNNVTLRHIFVLGIQVHSTKNAADPLSAALF
jgi:hypothetical protein